MKGVNAQQTDSEFLPGETELYDVKLKVKVDYAQRELMILNDYGNVTTLIYLIITVHKKMLILYLLLVLKEHVEVNDLRLDLYMTKTHKLTNTHLWSNHNNAK